MKKPLWVIGIDEVGRGPLAGPVTVCAVALPYNKYKSDMWPGLTDSKKMTAVARGKWFIEVELLKKKFDMRYTLASRTAKQIDRKGIAVCIKECITTILHELALEPHDTLVLLDGGLKAPSEYLNQQTIIRGDGSEPVISLASVIAKVTRDAYMTTQHKKYPDYDWYQNKGYGTKKHRIVLQNKGVTPLHRTTFLARVLDKYQII